MMLDKVLLVAVKAFCIAGLIHAAVLFDGLHIRPDGIGRKMIVDKILPEIVCCFLHNL